MNLTTDQLAMNKIMGSAEATPEVQAQFESLTEAMFHDFYEAAVGRGKNTEEAMLAARKGVLEELERVLDSDTLMKRDMGIKHGMLDTEKSVHDFRAEAHPEV